MRFKLSLIVACCVYLNGSDLSILSELKQKELDITKKENLQKYDKEKYEWIEPISGSIGITKYENYSKSEQEIKSYSISMSQPIFKSGGIYFAIKYANENRYFNELTTKLQEKSLINSAYSLLLNLKKVEQNILLQNFQLQNAKIDVQRKLEQYESGLLDSSYLDNAILKESSISSAIANLELQLLDLKKSFKVLSDLDIQNTPAPYFTLMSDEEFVKANLSIKQSNSAMKKSEYFEDIRFASYLPTLKFNASYINQDTKTSSNAINEYYTYGLALSMPLFDISRDNNLELARLAYLKSNIDHQQKLKEASLEYENVSNRLKVIDKKIELVKSDLVRYSSLVKITDEKFSIGEVTKHDVDTMKNSMYSKEIEIKLYELDKQLELLKLYEKIDDKI